MLIVYSFRVFEYIVPIDGECIEYVEVHSFLRTFNLLKVNLRFNLFMSVGILFCINDDCIFETVFLFVYQSIKRVRIYSISLCKRID